jgi:hypothetical protein
MAAQAVQKGREAASLQSCHRMNDLTKPQKSAKLSMEYL